ncbi:hypothetical protein HN51_027289 [Arachis hypogaea]
MKASKPNVNVTRGSKTKTQGKKAEYKKDECAASGGNRPEVRKKGDGGPRAIGPDIAKGKKKHVQPQHEMAVSQSAPLSQNEGSVEGSMQIPNPTSHDTQTENPSSRATTNVSSQPKVQQPFRRPKQTIRRPQVQGSVGADTTAATTSPAAFGMFKFIPTPGLNQSKKK